MLHVLTAKVIGPHHLNVLFSTGERKRVDLKPFLKGEIFKPLRDPGYFSLVQVDPECRTVVWPNGADLAPEALYDLEEIKERRQAKEIKMSPLNRREIPAQTLDFMRMLARAAAKQLSID